MELHHLQMAAHLLSDLLLLSQAAVLVQQLQ
jgi:hypothetical protein